MGHVTCRGSSRESALQSPGRPGIHRATLGSGVSIARLGEVFATQPASLLSIRGWTDVHLSAPVVLLLTILTLLLMFELGYRIGRRRGARVSSEGWVGIVLGALLAMLGLMLAFSFGIVESRFASRRALVLQEANAIGTTYLRAGMLPTPYGDNIRKLLRDYADVRLSPRTPESLEAAIMRSKALHREMWANATAVAVKEPDSEIVGLFVRSLNDVIDLHQSRVTIGLYARLPPAILVTLYFISLLGLWILGYSSGTFGRRGGAPTLAVALATASVIVVIVELDRPHTSMFHVSQRAISDVRDAMDDAPPLPARAAANTAQ